MVVWLQGEKMKTSMNTLVIFEGIWSALLNTIHNGIKNQSKCYHRNWIDFMSLIQLCFSSICVNNGTSNYQEFYTRNEQLQMNLAIYQSTNTILAVTIQISLVTRYIVRKMCKTVRKFIENRKKKIRFWTISPKIFGL